MSMQVVTVPIDQTFSDGDKENWPTDPKFTFVDERLYLTKLADAWMKTKGENEFGRQYMLDQLPKGYALMQRPRPQNPETKDKFLYGNPNGYFTSPNNFLPHFLYLMSHGEVECGCHICRARQNIAIRPTQRGRQRTSARQRNVSRDKPVRATHGTTKGKPRNFPFIDEEGTPDVFKELVVDLKAKKEIDTPIEEPLSMDWRAAQEQTQLHLTRTFLQHAFIPRIGELVLCVWGLKGDEIRYNKQSGTYQMYSRKYNRFLGVPDWRAGTITQVADERVLLEDVLIETKKKFNVNMSGFRVETLPDPNSLDKTASWHYRYVPLNHIRPFNYWHVFLQGLDSESWHPSIDHVMTLMSSISVLDKFHFKGRWPNASISCKAVYLGTELLIRGDTIRLVPKISKISDSDTNGWVTDVLVIDNIIINLSSCDADPSSPLLAAKQSLRVSGRAYTISPKKAFIPPGETRPTPLTDAELVYAFETVGMRSYGPWYPLHAPEVKMRVSPDQILGRAYESEYMSYMFHRPSLSVDLFGLLIGRPYSSASDARIPADKVWFWGDTRAQTLAVETLNGNEVGPFDRARDMHMLRANLRVLDGDANTADIRVAARGQGQAADRLVGGTPGVLGTARSGEELGKASAPVSVTLNPRGRGRAKGSIRKGKGKDEGEGHVSMKELAMQIEEEGKIKSKDELQSGDLGELKDEWEHQEEEEKSKAKSAKRQEELGRMDGGSDDEFIRRYFEEHALARGGTEETEGGDYVEEDDFE